MTTRKPPPPAAWLRLEGAFDKVTSGNKDAGYAIIRQEERLELRAAKLFATCIEQGLNPPGYEANKIAPVLRQRLDNDDRESGQRAETLTDAVGGDTGMFIGSPFPKPLPLFGAHGIAVMTWINMAFRWLPDRYPDSFDHPTPASALHPPSLVTVESMSEWCQRKASVQADACALLAGLCSATTSEEEWRTSRSGHDEYWPAIRFRKGMADRLRKAAAPGRMTKRVRKRTIDGQVCYRVADVRQWWPDALPE